MIKYLSYPSTVNIYTVGDIHGCYSLLIAELTKIGFDFSKDILIAVGDLVDRGEENEECVSLIDQPWFVTIKGNHEDFCIKGYNNSHYARVHRLPNNGGAWFYNLSQNIQKSIVDKFESLPVMLELDYLGKKIGFIHGDPPYYDWEKIKSDVGRLQESIMWGRSKIRSLDNTSIDNIDLVYLGHTPNENIVSLANCRYIDTGAVFGNKLSIVKITGE